MSKISDNLAALRKRKDALVTEGRALLEKAEGAHRDNTPDEKKRFDAIEGELGRVNRSIEMEMAASDLPPARFGDGPNAWSGYAGGGGPFPNLGAQLTSVVQAGLPSGVVDKRLLDVQAAATGLSEGVGSDSGFLVQSDFNNELLLAVYKTGILAPRCRRIQISGNSNSVKINGIDETSRASTRYGGILAYWLGEAGLKVGSQPKFRQMTLELKKLIGLCYATDESLQDASVLESVIKDGFTSEFGLRIDDAIFNGTGAGMPLGILNSGSLVTVAKETGQLAKTIVVENILKMYARLLPGSEATAAWFINKDTLPQLYTMGITVGTGGAPIFLPAGGIAGQPFNTLLGIPVVAIEQAASIGTVGDIVLADLTNGYVLAEKGGIQAASSIHVRYIYDETCFRFVYRVDGQPFLASPVTPFKGSDSLSHFVALATRA